MQQHFQRAIDNLKKQILHVSAVVEENLQEALSSLVNKDLDQARKVILSDEKIDQLEVEVEEECLKILALHQPVAIDLRYLVAILKINNDLERIGDLAANIAERTEILAECPSVPYPQELKLMAEKSQAMLKKSIDSLVDLDVEVAIQVQKDDDEVDEIHRNMYEIVAENINSNPETLTTWLQYQAISRFLERIADHATNICEDVFYTIEGDISRHQHS